MNMMDEETHTLTKKEKDEALDKLAGVWTDDPEGEMMAEAIRTGRRSNISDSFARQAKQEIDRLWESGELNEEILSPEPKNKPH